MTCAFCKRELAPGEAKRMPRGLVWFAATAAAFFHAGMWVVEELSGAYCARDRALVGGLFFAAAVFVLSAASFGVALWLRGPR